MPICTYIVVTRKYTAQKTAALSMRPKQNKNKKLPRNDSSSNVRISLGPSLDFVALLIVHGANVLEARPES